MVGVEPVILKYRRGKTGGARVAVELNELSKSSGLLDGLSLAEVAENARLLRRIEGREIL